jgi:hypothetical protein
MTELVFVSKNIKNAQNDQKNFKNEQNLTKNG